MSALDLKVIEQQVNVAGSTILVFDYLLTLNREFQLVWKQPWSPITILFLITRYTPFIDTAATLIRYFPQKNTTGCVFSNHFQTVFSVIGLCASETILITRTAAVWGNSKRVFWGLITLLAVIATTAMFLLENYIATASVVLSPFMHFCTSAKSDPSLFLAVGWIVILAFETVLVCLILPKAISQRIIGRSNIYDAVYAEGVRFYLCTSAISLVNIVILLYPFSEGGVPTTMDIMAFDRILHAILAQRLVLSIRTAAAGTVLTGSTVSTLSLDFYIPRSLYDSTERRQSMV